MSTESPTEAPTKTPTRSDPTPFNPPKPSTSPNPKA